jgi:hypothetical protein
MTGEIAHPDIRYVVYPVHRDGTPIGGLPRMRHDPDCGHFDWGDGEILGTPVLATEEQMRLLKACTSCVTRRSDSMAGSPRRTGSGGKLGDLCPQCRQVMSLTGICDNCG